MKITNFYVKPHALSKNDIYFDIKVEMMSYNEFWKNNWILSNCNITVIFSSAKVK